MSTKKPKILKCAGLTESQLLAHLKTRPVTIRRVARFIFNTYGQYLDLSDVVTKPDADRIDFLLTRAIAAHAVSALVGHDPRAAAECVVDGGQDLGIDAIAFDDHQKRCWVIQSKFQSSGKGLISSADLAKFLAGFNALVSDDFGHANPKILAMEDKIRLATTAPGWRFTLVLASTSADPLTTRSIDEIHEKLAYQDPGNSGTFTFENMSLNAVTDSIQKSLASAKIDLTIELHDWGCTNDPFTAYYGQVSLAAVITWRQHGVPLFDKNLRNFDISSHVVDSISRTLEGKSELFWYFNNGATILCERIERRGPYAMNTSRASGFFECKGVSVVNGAQTIGTIWEKARDGADLDPRAMMHLRLISLESAPKDFAQQVTKATNTQKNILGRDFATLDPEQQRIAHDFKLDGRKYVFRQSDQAPSTAEGCTIEELSIAMACATSVELAIIAYRNAGFLIDPDNPYYKIVFGTTGRPTADEAWLAVKILRASDELLVDLAKNSPQSRSRQVATHGRRFIQYRVMKDSSIKSLRGNGQTDTEIREIVREVTQFHFSAVHEYILRHHEGEYLQVVFKNTKTAKRIDEALDKISANRVRPGMPRLLFDEIEKREMAAKRNAGESNPSG